MGNFRPLPLKCWAAFLRFNGYAETRISASHHQWTKKGFRTIPVWGNEKEIPAAHLKAGCFTIGCSLELLYNGLNKIFEFKLLDHYFSTHKCAKLTPQLI